MYRLMPPLSMLERGQPRPIGMGSFSPTRVELWSGCARVNQAGTLGLRDIVGAGSALRTEGLETVRSERLVHRNSDKR